VDLAHSFVKTRKKFKMTIIKNKVLILPIVLGLLSACSPGMKMDESSHLRGTFSTQESQKTGTILITPSILAKMNVGHIKKPTYLVGEQDILMVKVWGDADLSTGVNVKNNDARADGLVVQNNGTIFYPYVGNVAVAGKSIEQIRILLTEKLSKYINDPQISVGISEYRSKRVHVMGEVRKPGTYPITDTPMSMLDVTMLGAINNRTADTEQIFVIRRAKTSNGEIAKPVIYRFNAGSADAMLLAGQFYLKADDVVFVAPAGVVSWNRVISNILPSAGLGAQIDSIGN
jgi:protein involved in polysaccharide export with SLBB domain